MDSKLRVVIADDERPARSFLAAMLRAFPDVDLVAEAANGAEALSAIERERPDLALLDLQMPEVDGLGVARLLQKNSQKEKDRAPLIAFVTAYDEHAVRAFELNAVDYLLKPVERARLRETLNRAQERLERAELHEDEAKHLAAAAADYEAHRSFPPFPAGEASGYLERIPIRQRDEILIVPVDRIASLVADGEMLHMTTIENRRYSFSHRLKDLEARLDPRKFVRLGRGTLARIDQINRVSPLPGGAYVVTLHNSQQLNVSRMQARILREQLLKL